jgi:predicted ATPase
MSAPAAPFVLAFEPRRVAGYAESIPALRSLGRVELDPAVTFFVGENGSGKSTLVEALALALHLNVEGGGSVHRFTTRRSVADLELAVERAPAGPLASFFLRAESFYNYATAIEAGEGVPANEAAVYDGSLHDRSHGESFLTVILQRFGPRGLYLLDEPEAALSLQGCLALMRRMHELVEAHSQLVVATHSPILLGFPRATIYELTDDGVRRVAWEDTEQVTLTRSFLDDRERFLRYLLED